MTSMKIGQFSRPATPFVQLRPKFFYSSNPLTLDVHFQTNKQTPPSPSQNYNQSIKRKDNLTKDDYCMLSGLSFSSALVLSINSLILSGFPLTFIPLAEVSLVPRAILKN